MYNGKMYGNFHEGMSYSPDRSYDVDRFNPSTRSNYSTTYNTKGYGYYSFNGYGSNNNKTGRYLGNGQYVED